MLVALSFAWGLTWPAMRIALDEIPPFSMRVVTLALGAGALFIVARLQGRSFALGGMKNAAHLAVSGILNVLSFSLLSVIAMMFAATGPRRDAVLHDADLGRAVRLARARRAVHRARASSRSCCAPPAWRS